MNTRTILTRIGLLFAVAVIAALVAGTTLAADNAAPVQLSIGNAGPREVEETTQKAIARDYGRAWQSMATALANSDPAALGDDWTGIARDKLRAQVESQQRSGVRTRIVDRGHRLQAMFYSAEGSALQLRDTAQIETQILDGDDIVGSDTATVNYVVVMTPSADRWQVRILQAVPSF